MYVCNVSIASLIRSLKENASEFVEKYRMINAANIVIGKPNEKRFKVGADRVIIPIVILTINVSPAIGSMMIVAAKNIEPAAVIPLAIIIPKFRFDPIGINA